MTSAQEQALRDSQLAMARYLRDPDGQPPPAGVEARRLKVYRDLIYNNIEGFIRSGFPVLRSLYGDEDWHALVRQFIDNHRCQTPYFLEISQEFIQFLTEDFSPRPSDPPFVAELAHYEWVELALDIAEEELPPARQVDDPLTAVPLLSPLAWVLAYRFPVHRIGPGYTPAEAGEPTFLAVYRNRDLEVRFMELNNVTARLLELVRDNDGATTQALLTRLAGDIGMDAASLQAPGLEQLEQLAGVGVITWR